MAHAGEFLTYRSVGHDGRTPFECLFGKPSQGDGCEFGGLVHCRAQPVDSGRSLSALWESGIWLGRRWGTAARKVATSASEAREVRAAARKPLCERWSRGTLQQLRAPPWSRRVEPPSGDVGPPDVILHAASDAGPPPPRPRATPAPRRANLTRELLEEHGYAAGCLKHAR
eukprot:14404943-Alexandrium_andersonii.AAC.1